MSAVMSAAARPRPDDTSSTAQRDLAFDGADFDRIRQLICERAGISLGTVKQAMVYSRVSRRLRGNRSQLIRQLPAMAGAGQQRRGRRRMAGIHQPPDHQPDLVLSRGPPFHRAAQ